MGRDDAGALALAAPARAAGPYARVERVELLVALRLRQQHDGHPDEQRDAGRDHQADPEVVDDERVDRALDGREEAHDETGDHGCELGPPLDAPPVTAP